MQSLDPASQALETMGLATEIIKELAALGIYPHIKTNGEVAYHVTDKRLFDAITAGCVIDARQRPTVDYPYELVAKNGQFEMFCLVPAAQVESGDLCA